MWHHASRRRFPTDFDGIIAGAPIVLDVYGDHVSASILAADACCVAHSAEPKRATGWPDTVYKKCDPEDGLKATDLISDPLHLRFPVHRKTCPNALKLLRATRKRLLRPREIARDRARVHCQTADELNQRLFSSAGRLAR